MTVILAPLDDQVIDTSSQAIGRIYARAFGASTTATSEFLANVFSRHRTYDGFQGRIAITGAGAVVGFAYGYPSRPGRWWREKIRPSLETHGLIEWLTDAFEFAELAVDPDAQGGGIGRRLHDDLLKSVPQATALLSTAQQESPAIRLYRSSGWIPLVSDFEYQAGGEPTVIMGLDLTSWRNRRDGDR